MSRGGKVIQYETVEDKMIGFKRLADNNQSTKSEINVSYDVAEDKTNSYEQ